MVWNLLRFIHWVVFLTEKLGAAHEDMKHLIVALSLQSSHELGHCVCASQRREHQAALRRAEEAQVWRVSYLYASSVQFTLDFTNICRPDNIQELASADETNCVKEVHEYYGDFIPIDTDHYTLNLIDGVQLCRNPSQWKVPENNMFHRATDVPPDASPHF